MEEGRRTRMVWMFRVGVVLLLGFGVVGAVEYLAIQFLPRVGRSDEWRVGVTVVAMVAQPAAYLLLVRPLFALSELWGRWVLRVAGLLAIVLGLCGACSGGLWLMWLLMEGNPHPGPILTVLGPTNSWIGFGVSVGRLLFAGALGVECLVLARPTRAAVSLRVSAMVLALWCLGRAAFAVPHGLALVGVPWEVVYGEWLRWPYWFGLGVSAVMWVPCVLLWWSARRVFTRAEEEGLCPECHYDLGGRLADGCPECGWGREERDAESGKREIEIV